MKIKVTCKRHGNTMDGSGKPFFIPVEGADRSESVWELDLSDLWCSESKWDETKGDYDPHCNEYKVEVLP